MDAWQRESMNKEWSQMWFKYTVFHLWKPRVEYAPVDRNVGWEPPK
jgi:hypothetical protein